MADFTLITPVFALTGVVLCGTILGYFCPKPWISAACFGVGVPIAITVLMALHGTPTRHHYVFLDARAIPLAEAAALGGMLMRLAGERLAKPATSG